MNKNVHKLLILFYLFSTVSALQDSYITIDSQNTGVCLAVDTLNNVVCNDTQYLQLDGTSDHIIYFTPEPGISSNSTMIEKMNFFVLSPITFFIGIAGVLFAVFVGVGLTYAILNLAGVRL